MGLLGGRGRLIGVSGKGTDGLFGFELGRTFISWCGSGRSACHVGAQAEPQDYD